MDLLTPGLGLFLWTLLAFILVFLILRKFAWKFIVSMLDERESGIAEALSAAEKVKAEMVQLQANNEQLLQQAREERASILKEAKESRDKIVAEAKAKAEAEASKLLENARLQIQNEKMAAITDVKNQIGILAVEVAEKVLHKELSKESEQANYAKVLAESVTLN
jgi:F-type H+-transporting ATPase subunit b